MKLTVVLSGVSGIVYESILDVNEGTTEDEVYDIVDGIIEILDVTELVTAIDIRKVS